MEEINNNFEANGVEEVKKKKMGIGKIILIVLLIFLLLLGGGIFWGYQKITSMVEPTDLGVKYTMQDYLDLVQNVGIEVEPEKLCLDCPALNFSDPHEVDLKVTGSQAAAAFDIVNERLSFGRVANTQVKFSDEKGELTTTFTYQDKDYPVYISGNIERTSDRTISGEIFELKAGNFKLPSGVKDTVEDLLVGLSNERLGTMEDSFRIDDVKLTNEGIDFQGLVPTKAE